MPLRQGQWSYSACREWLQDNPPFPRDGLYYCLYAEHDHCSHTKGMGQTNIRAHYKSNKHKHTSETLWKRKDIVESNDAVEREARKVLAENKSKLKIKYKKKLEIIYFLKFKRQRGDLELI